MGKTGTHSVAAVFARDHRAAHEAGAKELMAVLFAVADGTATLRDVRNHLVDRDARLALDMDASLVNGEVVADLVALFPGSRYVLTVREPHAWLDSMASCRAWRAISCISRSRVRTTWPPETGAST